MWSLNGFFVLLEMKWNGNEVTLVIFRIFVYVILLPMYFLYYIYRCIQSKKPIVLYNLCSLDKTKMSQDIKLLDKNERMKRREMIDNKEKERERRIQELSSPVSNKKDMIKRLRMWNNLIVTICCGIRYAQDEPVYCSECERDVCCDTTFEFMYDDFISCYPQDEDPLTLTENIAEEMDELATKMENRTVEEKQFTRWSDFSKHVENWLVDLKENLELIKDYEFQYECETCEVDNPVNFSGIDSHMISTLTTSMYNFTRAQADVNELFF